MEGEVAGIYWLFLLSKLDFLTLSFFTCHLTFRGGARNFCLGGQVAALIHLSRQSSYTYIYTHVFLLYTHTYIHTFLFDKLYIYTHPTHTKKEKRKKNLVFSIKVMFDDDFYKIKFIFSIFIVKFLKSFILNTNYQILY